LTAKLIVLIIATIDIEESIWSANADNFCRALSGIGVIINSHTDYRCFPVFSLTERELESEAAGEMLKSLTILYFSFHAALLSFPLLI